jgi:hypothetical protein
MRTDCEQEVPGRLVLLGLQLLRYRRGFLWRGELVPEELEWIYQPVQGLGVAWRKGGGGNEGLDKA